MTKSRPISPNRQTTRKGIFNSKHELEHDKLQAPSKHARTHAHKAAYNQKTQESQKGE